jgi:hypothetical protein
MYLPEPLLALVLCYFTDGDPVPRILRGSRPARVGEERDWAAVGRLMDLKAYTLGRRWRAVSLGMTVLLCDGDGDAAFAKAVINARAQTGMHLPPQWRVDWSRLFNCLLWYNDKSICCASCSFKNTRQGGRVPYSSHQCDALFICRGCLQDDEQALALHNGVDVFVV